MKIVAGLGSVDEYIPYVQAGADELFCGYVPYNWTKKYGTVLPLNRREVLAYNVQLGSFSELEILSAMIRKYRKPVHIAMNSVQSFAHEFVYDRHDYLNYGEMRKAVEKSVIALFAEEE